MGETLTEMRCKLHVAEKLYTVSISTSTFIIHCIRVHVTVVSV